METLTISGKYFGGYDEYTKIVILHKAEYRDCDYFSCIGYYQNRLFSFKYTSKDNSISDMEIICDYCIIPYADKLLS